MPLNADRRQRAVAFAADAVWLPAAGGSAQQRWLECGRGTGTSILKLAPGGSLPAHEHEGGEEFLVLAGSCEDEHGRYAFGTYGRNPPGSCHRLLSPAGCALFVKEGQLHPADGARVLIDTLSAEWFPGVVKGIATLPLHRFGSELVSLVRFAAGTVFPPHGHPAGEEILVLEGTLEDEDDAYPAGTWLRQPPGSRHRPFSLTGCLLYVKIGHLPAVTAGPR